MRRWPWPARWRTACWAPDSLSATTASALEPAGGAVDEDDGGSGADVGGEVALVVAGRRDDDAVGSPHREGTDEVTLALRVLVDAAREDQHAPLVRGVLQRPQQRCRERVGEVLEHGGDGGGLAVAAAQAAGGHVGSVVELRHRSLDLRDQRRSTPPVRG